MSTSAADVVAAISNIAYDVHSEAIETDHFKRTVEAITRSLIASDWKPTFANLHAADANLAQKYRDLEELFATLNAQVPQFLTAQLSGLEECNQILTNRVDTLEELADTVESAKDNIREHEDRLDELASKVEDLEHKTEDFESYSERLDDLERENLASRVEDLEDTHTPDRLKDLEDLTEKQTVQIKVLQDRVADLTAVSESQLRILEGLTAPKPSLLDRAYHLFTGE